MSDRKMIGHRNRMNGELFEKIIEASCSMYAYDETAFIQKTPEPMKVIRALGNGRFEAVFTKAAQPDFKGCLSSGQMVIFDAKHTETKRVRQDAVTDAQEMYFNKYEKMGAVCFILVSIGLESFYRIPWAVWKTMGQTYGRKYMTMEELQPFKLTESMAKIRFLDRMVRF